MSQNLKLVTCLIASMRDFGSIWITFACVLDLLSFRCYLKLCVHIFRRDLSGPETHESGEIKRHVIRSDNWQKRSQVCIHQSILALNCPLFRTLTLSIRIFLGPQSGQEVGTMSYVHVPPPWTPPMKEIPRIWTFQKPIKKPWKSWRKKIKCKEMRAV